MYQPESNIRNSKWPPVIQLCKVHKKCWIWIFAPKQVPYIAYLNALFNFLRSEGRLIGNCALIRKCVLIGNWMLIRKCELIRNCMLSRKWRLIRNCTFIRNCALSRNCALIRNCAFIRKCALIRDYLLIRKWRLVRNCALIRKWRLIRNCALTRNCALIRNCTLIRNFRCFQTICRKPSEIFSIRSEIHVGHENCINVGAERRER